MLDHWDLAGRDVVPSLAAAGKPGDAGASVLLAMLGADGMTWAPPYEDFRRALRVRRRTHAVEPALQEQADSRLRTYLVLFRGLGLVYEEGGTLHITELGKQLHALLEEQYRVVDAFGAEVAIGARGRLARLVAPALARYQLASPLKPSDYPTDADVRPLLSIWRAMRRLDDKLHWDELDRTLTACLRESEIEAAINRVEAARLTPNYDPNDAVLLDTVLGPRRPAVESQADRVDVWLSRAGFKSLFIEQSDRPDGYRYLNPEFIPLLDELISNPPAFNPTSDLPAYVEWMGEGIAASTETTPDLRDSQVGKVIETCIRFGGTKIVALVGPAGTGKTSVAQRAALALADGDEGRVRMIQFHAAMTYEEFVGGLAPREGGGFAPKSGVLLELNERAKGDPDKNYVLVIDEFSRADVANVLGELLTYIEYRDRAFTIPTLGREERIAPNLVVIATMNPTDRSVVNMDDALVRRLRQISIPASTPALRAILLQGGCASSLTEQVCAWFDRLPIDKPFGHGLFVGVADESDLFGLWHEELSFLIRRGGVAVYPEPEAIESGFVWRLTPAEALSDVTAAPDLLTDQVEFFADGG